MNKLKEILKKIKAALASDAGRNFLLGNIIIAKGGMSKKQQNEMVDSIIKKIDALLDDNGEVILSKIENVANLSAQDIVKDIINAVAPQFNKIAESQCQNFNELLDKINALELDEDKIFSKLDDIEKAIKEDGEITRADIANAKDDVNKHGDENTDKIIKHIDESIATSKNSSGTEELKIDVVDGSARVTRYDGCAKSVEIPSIYKNNNKEYSVAIIRDNVFKGKKQLEDITIPNSVTKIGKYAFFDCNSLSTVYYKGELNEWLGIEFEDETANPMHKAKELIINDHTLKGELVIPDEVKSINDYAFLNCNDFTKVTIPASVEYIGAYAFKGCNNKLQIFCQAKSKPYGWDNNWNPDNIDVEWGYDITPAQKDKNATSDITADVDDSKDAVNSEATDSDKNDTTSTSPDGSKKSVTPKATGSSDFDYDIYQGGIRIKRYIGNAKDVVIPSLIEGKRVTSIGNLAFSDCTGLTSITIPDSVKSIGWGAFDGCTGLTSITIPDSVTSICDRVFYGCTGLTSITIPDSVMSIGNWAFNGCKGLTSITIPGSVTSIGDYAFEDCDGLTSITIPDSVTSIAWGVFEGCTGLTSITIPDSVTSIGFYAFGDCSGLTSITIPDSVTSIGTWAFNGCKGLTDVYYQGDLSGWLGIEFYGSPMEYADNLYINGELLQGELVIPEGTEKIGVYAFKGCTGLTSITIPDSVESIGANVFSGCTGLTSVTIGDGVKSIAFNAFSGCKSIETAIMPAHAIDYIPQDSLTTVVITSGDSIGYGAFEDCSTLTSITISNTVTSIGDYALWCTGLTSITIPDSVTSIGAGAFLGCSSLENIEVEKGNSRYHSKGNCLIETASKTLIAGCSNSVIPSDGSVTSIGGGAFSICAGLTSITIPDSVTSIGVGAFWGCSALKSIVIPDRVTRIGNRAFSYCTGLTRIIIPDSVKRIGKDVFKSCNELTISCEAARKPLRWSRQWNPGNRPVYWGQIIGGTKAKKNTGFLREHKMPIVLIAAVIIALIVIIPIAVHFSERVGYNLDENGTLTIYGSGEITGKIPGDGVKNVIIEEGITRIGDRAFSDCTGLTSITIPDSVTSIGDRAFSDCTALTSITIPDSVTSIGDRAFYGCTGLTSVSIGDSVTSIGSYAFYNCSNLTSITIPDSVISIGEYAFYGCSGLTSITIPDSVTSIGYGAFVDCDGLTDVYYQGDLSGWLGIEFGDYASNPMYYADNLYINGELLQGELVIPEGTEKIGDYVFYNCSGLTSVTIPDSVTSIGDCAFSGCRGLTSITIPDSVTSIGYWAFSRCSGLTSITIPDSVTSIGGYAFGNCRDLTDITFQGTMEQWNNISKVTTWNNSTPDYTVTCTDGVLDKNGQQIG